MPVVRDLRARTEPREPSSMFREAAELFSSLEGTLPLPEADLAKVLRLRAGVAGYLAALDGLIQIDVLLRSGFEVDPEQAAEMVGLGSCSAST